MPQVMEPEVLDSSSLRGRLEAPGDIPVGPSLTVTENVTLSSFFSEKTQDLIKNTIYGDFSLSSPLGSYNIYGFPVEVNITPFQVK